MKRVILVNHRSQVPNYFSGITRYTFSLLGAFLDRNNFDFILATTWSKDRLPQKLQDGLCEVITVKRPRPYSWNMVRQIFEDLGSKTGAEIILNVDQIGLMRGGKARLFIAHDLYFRAIPEALSWKDRLQQRYFIWPLMLKFNQRIACVSGNTRRDVEKFYPHFAGKTEMIGAGVDLTGANVERHYLIDALDRPYVLYVGNILPNKNIKTLTTAVDLLARDGGDVRVVHVGRDDHGLLKRAALDMRYAKPPVSLSPVSDGQLFFLYANALCFVNTSLYEGFCLPVIEAQQAGAPVVCSWTPAVAETAGDGAILFDPRSPEQLAQHIQELIANPGMRRRLQEAGHKNCARFSWQNVAERLESVFCELLGDSK
jgi:glycosyltransferase involved in cell wall biosynthesis